MSFLDLRGSVDVTCAWKYLFLACDVESVSSANAGKHFRGIFVKRINNFTASLVKANLSRKIVS